jgi:hypothetical protein
MSTQTKRTVPPAGSVQRPWLWRLWVALIVAFFLAIGAHYVFRPDLQVSTPTLSFRDGICTASFDATNHTDHPTSAVLHVIIGSGSPGSDSSPPSYTEIARKALGISLPPKTRQTFTCDLPLPTPTTRANTARIEFAPHNTQIK